MKILVLNRGSSSIKCCLYDFTNYPEKLISPLWEGHVQWKNNFESPSIKIKNERGDEASEEVKAKSAGDLLKHIAARLIDGKFSPLRSLDEVNVVGHRIVHGGRDFKESIFVDASVKQKISALSELAPLHNTADLEGIELFEKLFKNKPQVAVFDTAFHHTMPEASTIYPGPYSWYEEGVQRYGFHGISFQYCSKRAAQLLKEDLKPLKVVICHLGSGASLCAIKEGKSIDTTMGFTPLDGLMMDTRSGSIDPAIILHLLKKKRKSADEITKELYYKSGLLGVSGVSSDMRDIVAKSIKGDQRAKIAFDVYLHRLNALIGSMLASLKGMDVLIFTAGIGENASLLRKRVCENFSFLGLKLNKAKNELQHLEDCKLAAPGSKVKILLIHTQEAFEIARECWSLSSKKR